ncbi:hypothetical protein ACHWQZ_G001751 [Mnemiopsis leidyi]
MIGAQRESSSRKKGYREMKFLLLGMLAYLGFSHAQEEALHSWEEDGVDGPLPADWSRTRSYNDRTPGPTTAPMPIRQILGIRKWDVEDLVDKVTTEEGTAYRFTEGIVEAVENHVIPELCYLTAENFTVYNSFLLDKQCLEEFDSVSPQCRGFRCNVVRYFLEHGARIYMDVINAATIKEGLETVNREVLAAFEELDMCTCGRQFFRAAFKCAPYWHANALYAVTGNNGDDMMNYYKVLRTVDVKSFAKAFDRLLTGFCEESSHGMCINSIIYGAGEMLELVITTMREFQSYNDGDRNFQKSQEKRCDAVFGLIRAWNFEYFGPDERIELLFNKTAAASRAFYCKRGCKNDASRTAMYPCCLRKMLEDKKLFQNIITAAESVYRGIPAMSNCFVWEFYELSDYFYECFSREDLAEQLNWTVSERMRDAVMRTLHAAKYCDGKLLRCSN